MGEKIKDLHNITIGGSSFMIELNEGYSSSQGRLIHIQNPKFRFLLKENEFYHLASMIMRGWSEFTYLKSKPVKSKENHTFNVRDEISKQTTDELNQLTSYFNNENIQYRVLDVQNRMITIVIHPSLNKYIDEKLSIIDWKKNIHPYGEEVGYKFLYQMEPFKLYKKENLYLEIYHQLPCASLTPKTWIPLDRKIQSFMWKKNESIQGYQECDIRCKIIYHLCWAVFFNRGFSPYERQFIEKNKILIDDQNTRELLKTVFFNFTEELITLIMEDQFDQIIPDYYTFQDY